MDLELMWKIFYTKLGAASIIAGLATLYFSMEWRHNLHDKNKLLHKFLSGGFFGLLAIIGSITAIETGGLQCNARNIATLYGGLTGGPITAVIAGLIGGLFRWLVIGGPTGLPCGMACFVSGIVGAVAHKIVKKKYRYGIVTGIIVSVISEVLHYGINFLFGKWDAVKNASIPSLLSVILGMVFCLYMYKVSSYKWKKTDDNQ